MPIYLEKLTFQWLTSIQDLSWTRIWPSPAGSFPSVTPNYLRRVSSLHSFSPFPFRRRNCPNSASCPLPASSWFAANVSETIFITINWHIFKGGTTRVTFYIFVLFKQNKLLASAGFEFRWSESKVSMLTTGPPPRPNFFLLTTKGYSATVHTSYRGKNVPLLFILLFFSLARNL